ncbi:MAG: hypothetical protein JEZ09_05420, partial [Salinivirgaceae bacterium]|nr:hypothetical protein [Salinivirgaceae bacterium]
YSVTSSHKILIIYEASLGELYPKRLKKETTVDFWESLPQEQKADILHGIEEIKNGEIVDYDDFMKKHR